jgi:formylglycine-generating enzyme required for sulfatase activity
MVTNRRLPGESTLHPPLPIALCFLEQIGVDLPRRHYPQSRLPRQRYRENYVDTLDAIVYRGWRLERQKMKQTLLIPLFLAWACIAQGEQRVALVIGNGAYQDAPLRNPPNDARAMAQALRECGFEVIEKINANQRGMIEAVRDFGKKIRGGGVGLFYYAGHGMQVRGANYLVPVGTDVQSEDDVEFEFVDANRVLRQMESAGNGLNLIILDACRNNPFTRSFRSADRGLKKMDAPRGSLLAYATAPGKVAADGDGQNGLYTSILLEHMSTPGATVLQVFQNVGKDVQQRTGGAQVPWIAMSLTDDFYFLPGESMPGSSPPPAPITPPPPAMVQFGHLQVNVNATNSQVYVDGPYRGVANPGQPLNLRNIDVGQVSVRVTAQGYKEQTARATLQAGEWTPLMVKLSPMAVTSPPIVKPPVRQPSTSPSSRTRHTGQTLTARLPGGATMEFVWIEPGTFMMGSPESEEGRSDNEGLQHKVTISRGFYLGKFEITQWQWELVMGTHPWVGQNYMQANANHPAVYISWNDLQEFLRKLNQAEEAEVYRLPTEAEWEYSCRAGTTSRWPFGNRESDLNAYAWYSANAWEAGLQYAQPMGQRQPNTWGLYDMLGNVLEWCQDSYGDYLGGWRTDPLGPAPLGPADNDTHVGRGGSFSSASRQTRSAYRVDLFEDARSSNIGARLLRTR